MRVHQITNPVRGERVIAAAPLPPLAPATGTWRRRLNLYRGRALSDTALTTEQRGRAGRLATRGQMLSPGIVIGLEVGIEFEPRAGTPAPTVDARRPGQFYHIAAGMGLAAGGEDVVVPRPLRVNLRDVPVYAPAALLDGAGGTTTPGGLLPRRLGRTFGALRDAGRPLPPAGMLLLQPVTAETIESGDDRDPCEVDPRNAAFADWQQTDGCRLVFYTWPVEWLPLPERDGRWRNRLAYAIFERERTTAPGTPLPWEEVGLPIALVGFDDAGTPLFADRNAVARAGGKPKRRTSVVTAGGTPFLWQARLLQFAEQLGELPEAPTATLAAQFRHLPPVGLLPRDALEPRAARNHFFPAGYRVRAMPAPLEQLDVAVKASASLAPFDLSIADDVEVLVPVPQVWYEPRLLTVEQVDPEFQREVDRYVADRGRWLQRRADVRARATKVAKAITGKDLTFPTPDPEALEEETVATGPIEPPEDDFTVTGETPAALKTLRDELLAGTVKNEVSVLDARGVQGLIEELETKVRRSDDHVDFGFLRVQTDIYRIRQVVLGNVNGTRLAVSPALATIARGDSAAATRENLSQFYDSLKKMTTPQESPPAPAGGGGGGGGAGGSPIRGVAIPNAIGAAPGAFGGTVAGGSALGDRPSLGVAGGLGPVEIGSTVAGGRDGAPLAALLNPQLFPLALGSVVPDSAPATVSLAMAPGLAAELASATAVAPIGKAPKVSATVGDIIGQTPVVGLATLRTVTIGERLQPNPGTEAREFSIGSKAEVVTALKALPIDLSEITVPGIPRFTGETPVYDPKTHQVQRETKALAGLNIREVLREPAPQATDEAAHFVAGVELLDHTIALLRQIEGRVQEYRAAAARARETLKALLELGARVDTRLKQIGDELAEARHDVATARALLAEETARVAAINARRDAIIAQHVTFLLFRRPRTVDLLQPLPVRALDPGVVEAPVPACLMRDVPAPPELRALVDLLRPAPLKWFTHLPRLLDRLDGLDALRGTVQAAKQRASLELDGAGSVAAPTAVTATGAAGTLGTAIRQVFVAQQQVVTQNRLQTARLDLGGLDALTWQQARDQAHEMLSLRDLIDAGHGRPDVAREAMRELDSIARVAACLYESFGEVLPAIRLDWAERLSQYDGPANLRNLAGLPRWGEIDVLERRQMQGLVDWLFQRVDARGPEAVALINDLVRVCILLASHSPVNGIIAGQVSRPTTATRGGRVELAVDPANVRIGMHVLMYAGADVVARGVVEDLSAGRAAARVVHTRTEMVQLAQNARVQFAEAGAFARML